VLWRRATRVGWGVDALDADRLDALLPAGPTVSRTARIGAADVEAIEQATALFRRSDFSQGGGMCRPMVVAKLRSVLALHHATCTSAVRERLMMATADLGKAHQSPHLRQPREALSLVQLGYGVGTRRAQPLSASTASHLASYQAWGQAALSDARASDRAVGQAIEHFTHVDPDTAAPWAAHITIAELAAMQGHAQYTLALATADPKHAARAVPQPRSPHPEPTTGCAPSTPSCNPTTPPRPSARYAARSRRPW
jgi:hypothetical protein